MRGAADRATAEGDRGMGWPGSGAGGERERKEHWACPFGGKGGRASLQSVSPSWSGREKPGQRVSPGHGAPRPGAGCRVPRTPVGSSRPDSVCAARRPGPRGQRGCSPGPVRPAVKGRMTGGRWPSHPFGWLLREERHLWEAKDAKGGRGADTWEHTKATGPGAPRGAQASRAHTRVPVLSLAPAGAPHLRLSPRLSRGSRLVSDRKP